MYNYFTAAYIHLNNPFFVVKMAATQNNQTPVSIAYVTSPATSGPLQVNATASSSNQRFKVRAAKITGGLQIACAVLSVMFGVLAILIATCAIGDVNTCRNNNHYGSFPAVVGWPIWGGVSFYGVAGILGVCSGSKNKCVIVAYMVMSIMSSVSACGQLIMESIGAAINGEYCTYTYTGSNGGSGRQYTCYSLSGLQAVHSLSAVVAFVEMVVAIVSAAYCCHGVCGQPPSPPPQQVIVQYQPNAQGQVFQQPPPGPFQLNTQGQVQYQPNAQGQVFQQLPSGLFQLNNQGQVFHQAPAGPFQPNVQAVYPPPTAPLQHGQMLHQPPNVQPGNTPTQNEEVNDRTYQELVRR